LSGFFDGTASPDAPKFSGVAGYLFDDDGLTRYRAGAEEIRYKIENDFGLCFNVFHATRCCGNSGRDEFTGWPTEVRLRLCREMALLAADTRLAGFATFAEQADFDTIKQYDERQAARIGGLYPATLLAGIERVASYAKQKNERVFYRFEQGDPKQNVADDFLARIGSDERLRERFACFSHELVPKGHSEAVALAAADQLAWECKRNFAELLHGAVMGSYHSDDHLSETFKILRGREHTRWFETHLSGGALNVQLLVKFFYGLP
jgi:hypothetical protein